MSKVFLFLLLLLFSCDPQTRQEGIKPRTTDITESVYASVLVKPEDAYSPQTTRPGIIKAIWVEEGQKVEKGQALFQVRVPSEIEKGLTNARLSLEESQEYYSGINNQLLNLESELQMQRDQIKQDSLALARQERLWKQNIGKKTELERAQLTYEINKNQYSILEKRYVQTRVRLENQYKKALNQFQAQKEQLIDYTVYSELSGTVYALHKKVGEFISTQEPFAEIGSSDHFLLEMEVDEVDITKMEVGDSVTIALDAYPNTVFLASTTKIFPKKDAVTQTFRLECHFIENPPKLYDGLSGEANIIIDRRKGVLVIPSEYLIQGERVLTREGEKKVEVGLKNLQMVELLSGLDTGTVLLKPRQP